MNTQNQPDKPEAQLSVGSHDLLGQLVKAAFGMYRLMPSDPFCSQGELRAKQSYREAIEKAFPGKTMAQVHAELA